MAYTKGDSPMRRRGGPVVEEEKYVHSVQKPML